MLVRAERVRLMIVFSSGWEWLLIDVGRWRRGLLDALSRDELVPQACIVRGTDSKGSY